MTRVSLFGLLASLLACLAACSPQTTEVPPTQVLVRVQATPSVSTALHTLRVRFFTKSSREGKTTWPAAAERSYMRPETWPVDVPVVNRAASASEDFFEVVAEALDEGGQVIVQERAITSFVKGEQVVLSLTLAPCADMGLGFVCEKSAACHGTDCLRCESGRCVRTKSTPSGRLPALDPNGKPPNAPQDALDVTDDDGKVTDDLPEADAGTTPMSCTPRTCKSAGAECGLLNDGCGKTIDCDPLLIACALPAVCGGNAELGSHRCGCTPKSCEELGAACGVNVPDGCGGIHEVCGQGDCSGEGNLYECAGDLSACECKAPKTVDQLCAESGHTCGPIVDACGQEVSCGECTVNQECDTTGDAHVCKCDESRAAELCELAGATCGQITSEDGCEFSCGNPCVVQCASKGACGECTCPAQEVCYQGTCCEDLDPCKGALCGTVVDACGREQTCGSGCEAGESCVDPDFEGEYRQACVPDALNPLLGKYAVRSYDFHQTLVSSQITITLLNRAEAVAVQGITYNPITKRLSIAHKTCGMFAGSFPTSGGPSASVRARNMQASPIHVTEADVLIDGNNVTWVWTIADPGISMGYGQGIPDGCPSSSAVPLTAGDSRRNKWFAGDECRCPTDATKAPARTYSTAVNQDCRVEDPDGDSKPGFSLDVTARAGNVTQSNTNYIVWRSRFSWSGRMQGNGYHSVINSPVVPSELNVIGCEKASPCTGPRGDCTCRGEQPVNFVPLADDHDLTCGLFYTAGQFDTSAVANTFLSLGTCSVTSDCPVGSRCSSGQCRPLTLSGGCATSADCGAGMTCAGGSCWPTSAACPQVVAGNFAYCSN